MVKSDDQNRKSNTKTVAIDSSEKYSSKWSQKTFKRIKKGYFWWIQYQKYMNVLKIQNENNNDNMSQMQTAGRNQRSTVDNLIILNSKIENQRENKSKKVFW